MPLIVMTGIPSSGKSTRTAELKKYFEEIREKRVHIISEIETITKAGFDRNSFYAESKNEKGIRSDIKSAAQRLLNPNDVLIIDGSNYIKGYRYEIYCMTKLYKTPQCTIHCDIPVEYAWLCNTKRPAEEQYSREIFDALVMRYEVPDGKNRWDSPLFAASQEDELRFDDIYKALYEAQAPKPNLSTQCPRLSSTNYLYEIERETQMVADSIAFSKNCGVETDFKIPNCNLRVEGPLTVPQLLKLKKQFINYCKMQQTPVEQIVPLFVQYLNKSL